MSAPISGYTTNSGSLFQIDKHIIDLEKVDIIKTKPVFPGSGSISPTSFIVLVNSVEKTIDNSEAVSNLNRNNYMFPRTFTQITDLGELLNLDFTYSSSINKIVISPPGNFSSVLTTHYGLTNSNVSKSFQNNANKRVKHNFTVTSFTYVTDVSSSLYGFTYMNLNTSSLGSTSSGSIYITQSRVEYYFDAVSASIDLYNSFVSSYNNMSSSLKAIKGSIN